MNRIREFLQIVASEKKINFFGRELKYDYISSIIFAFILFYTIFKIVIPFFLYNNLLNWDFPGQVFLTWYEKNYLFPKPIGWNPYFFGGFPQNQFYSPLFSYISAMISFIFPVETSFKLLSSLSLLLLPVSFYFFSKAYNFGRIKNAIVMLGMFATLFLFPKNYFGGNFSSVFHAGLIVHMFGLVLFFFYVYVLKNSIEKNRFLLSSIFLALVILSHIVVAIFASIFLLSELICNFKQKEKRNLLIKHGVLSFLLSSFWTIPFVGKMSYLASYEITNIPKSFFFIALVVILIGLIFNSDKRYTPAILSLFILLFFEYLSFIWLNIPIHLYRFTMFFFLFIPLFAYKITPRSWSLYLSAVIIISSIIIISANPINATGEPSLKIEKIKFDIRKDERVIITPSLNKSYIPHVLQHRISLENKAYSLKGLFVESSKNSRIIFALDEELIPGAAAFWGAPLNYRAIPRDKDFIIKLLPHQFNIFAVNWIVGPSNLVTPSQKITEYQNEPYYLYHTSNFSIVEILKTKPRVVKKDWENEIMRWFLSEEVSKNILVNEEVPDYIGSSADTIKIIEMSPRQDYIKLQVNSSGRVPIFLKISEFPNWKAYENGVEIKIYRASPYLMLVYGTGTIEFRYENTFWDILGNLFSKAGLLAMIFSILFSFLRKSQNIPIFHPERFD